MELAEIGAKVFSFALIFSLINTVVVIAMIAAGLPPELLDIPLYLPASMFYKNVQDIVSKLPEGQVSVVDLLWVASGAMINGLVQFAYTLLFGVLALVHTIAMIVPPQVRFLVAPLYFIGAFLQLMIWYYLITRIFTALKPG